MEYLCSDWWLLAFLRRYSWCEQMVFSYTTTNTKCIQVTRHPILAKSKIQDQGYSIEKLMNLADGNAIILWFLVDVFLWLGYCQLMYPSMLPDLCNWMFQLVSALWCWSHQRPFCWIYQNQSISIGHEPWENSPASNPNEWCLFCGCRRPIQASAANKSSMYIVVATNCRSSEFFEGLNRLFPSPCIEDFQTKSARCNFKYLEFFLAIWFQFKWKIRKSTYYSYNRITLTLSWSMAKIFTSLI